MNYPDIDCTWEPYNNLKDTQALDRWEDTSHTAASMANVTNNSEMEEEFLLNEPLTIREAISSPNGTGWQQAIREEYNSLMKNQTWELVKLPKDCKTIKCKWIFCHKLNKDGQVEQLKARLVTKGYSQLYGVDYLDMYALVAKLARLQ